MKVHVCIYEHRHGTDVSVHRERAGAIVAGGAVAREWWGEAREYEPTLPELPPAGDEQAMALYFGAREGFELFEIRPCEVQGRGRPARLIGAARGFLIRLIPRRGRSTEGGLR